MILYFFERITPDDFVGPIIVAADDETEAWTVLSRREGQSVQALRAYKESFSPTWSPRYVALPGGLRLNRSLRDLASLIAGEAPTPR